MGPRGLLTIALGMAATLVAVAGCADSAKEPSQPAPGAPAPAVAAPTATNQVVMGDYVFRPANLTVKAGEPVTFVNDGKVEHTVADTTPAGEIRSRLIKPRPLATGQTQQVTFRVPGQVTYTCTFHPTLMSGRITVVK